MGSASGVFTNTKVVQMFQDVLLTKWQYLKEYIFTNAEHIKWIPFANTRRNVGTLLFYKFYMEDIRQHNINALISYRMLYHHQYSFLLPEPSSGNWSNIFLYEDNALRMVRVIPKRGWFYFNNYDY